MPRRLAVWMLALALTGAARVARGEDRSDGWDGRVFLDVNGGYHPGGGGFGYGDAQSILQEEASARASFRRRGGPALEVSGGLRLSGRFGLGATLSAMSERQSTTLSVTVPHPLLFGRPATGTAADTSHRHEQALHLHALAVAPLGRRLRLELFAGPSRFWVHQEMVADAELEPTLDDDLRFAVALPTLLQKTVSASAWGFHAGGALSVRVAKHLAIGGLARYSRGRVQVENALRATRTGDGDRTVSLALGGLSVTAGLKLWF